MKTKSIALSEIQIDGGTQIRVKTDSAHVAELADVISDGKQVPPVEVVHDGATYWLVDGFHRLLAYQKAGVGVIGCVVAKGDQRDAILKACGVNADHGLKRSNDDKRNAVMTLLNDKEWAAKSDRWIADTCRVSHGFVAKLRPTQVVTLPPDGEQRREGRDGKSYSLPTASNSTTAASVDDCGDTEQDDGPESNEPEGNTKEAATASVSESNEFRDTLGRIVPGHLVESASLSAQISGVRNLLVQVKKEVNKLMGKPGGEFLPNSQYLDTYDALLKGARFWTTCPKCDGNKCHACRDTGFLRHGVNLSAEMKKKLIETGADAEKML